MKRKEYFIGLTLLVAAALQVSCQREDLPVQPSFGRNVHGEEITVRMSIGMDREEAGTPGAREFAGRVDTKSVDDPDDTTGITATVIKDFYVLQFNGTADSSKLIGAQYFEDYEKFKTGENPNGPNGIKLISSSADDAVFVIANTCSSELMFPYGMPMSDLKSRVKVIASQADLFGMGDATGSGTSFPDDRKYHIMMNAQENRTISDTAVLNMSLKRNVARIKVIINNHTDTTAFPVTIKTLSIRNVPTTSPYITNTIALQPQYIPSSELIQTFDYPEEPYKEAGNVFYVPVNKRGTNDNTTQNSKGLVAPASSTYLWVNAEYDAGGVMVPISYSFYLGANFINDYNLLANNVYTYTINMTTKGDAEFDYRVEDWGPVDFTKFTVERANCYILNPAETYSREFKIPIDRIRTFWGGEGMTDNTGYEKYDDNTDPVKFMNQTFSAYILWTDIEDINDKVTVDMTGHNFGSGAYFTATVAPGTEGNAVVAVQGSRGEILWSWHLWITDYKPDEIKRYSPENGKYIYPVRGGAMHRYAGDIWETGIYKGKFIMDRNLGALDTTFVDASTEGKGVLYYQFGRKDPLPGMKRDGTQRPALYYPKSDLADGLKWKVVGASDDGAAFTDASAVRYSVKYPLAFIIRVSPHGWWTYDNKYNPKTYNSAIRWQDPNVLDDNGKSLFDPCPLGYRVPKDGTWSDFNSYEAAQRPKPTTNILGEDNPPRKLPRWSSTDRGWKNQLGLHYYPGTGDVGKTIYFPASGILLSWSGAFSSVGSGGYYWSCSPCTTLTAHLLLFNSVFVGSSSSNYRAAGFPVRCIQE